MSGKISVVAISAAFAACVFGATAGFSEDATPLRMRGTLDQVNGNTLTIKTKSGTPVTVQLKDGAPVVALSKPWKSVCLRSHSAAPQRAIILGI
jgi:hypothetical protein